MSPAPSSLALTTSGAGAHSPNANRRVATRNAVCPRIECCSRTANLRRSSRWRLPGSVSVQHCWPAVPPRSSTAGDGGHVDHQHSAGDQQPRPRRAPPRRQHVGHGPSTDPSEQFGVGEVADDQSPVVRRLAVAALTLRRALFGMIGRAVHEITCPASPTARRSEHPDPAPCLQHPCREICRPHTRSGPHLWDASPAGRAASST